MAISRSTGRGAPECWPPSLGGPRPRNPQHPRHLRRPRQRHDGEAMPSPRPRLVRAPPPLAKTLSGAPLPRRWAAASSPRTSAVRPAVLAVESARTVSLRRGGSAVAPVSPGPWERPRGARPRPGRFHAGVVAGRRCLAVSREAGASTHSGCADKPALTTRKATSDAYRHAPSRGLRACTRGGWPSSGASSPRTLSQTTPQRTHSAGCRT
mmetsp:Transcript_117658/g.332864  ORF Transcript_117658/g.332864 Transcript_117658/m.332864 type:complete len:210 (-) Transcript_117658:1123-1752(-)